jgi:hypothetical protein
MLGVPAFSALLTLMFCPFLCGNCGFVMPLAFKLANAVPAANSENQPTESLQMPALA